MNMGYWSIKKCKQMLTIIIMIGINIMGDFIKDNFWIIVNMAMGCSIFLVIFILGNSLIINLKNGIYIWKNNDLYMGSFINGMKHGQSRWVSGQDYY
jgi:hypothetical protein